MKLPIKTVVYWPELSNFYIVTIPVFVLYINRLKSILRECYNYVAALVIEVIINSPHLHRLFLRIMFEYMLKIVFGIMPESFFQ